MQDGTPKNLRDIVESENRRREEFLRHAGLTPEFETIQDQVRRLTADRDSWKEKPWQLPQEKMLEVEPNPTIDFMRQQTERAIEAQQLEQEKLECAWRSADASEAAVAAALERAEAAEKDAKHARRTTNISLWIAAVSLAATVWQLVKEFF